MPRMKLDLLLYGVQVGAEGHPDMHGRLAKHGVTVRNTYL